MLDIHQRLFAYNVQIAALVLCAIACVVAIRVQSFKGLVVGAGAWLFALIVLGGIWPGIVQKTSVDPNQFAREKEYIARNIAATRQGFGLANVQRVDNFPANNSLNAAQIQANRDTLDNVRLWDYPYLGKVYGQLQTIKQYYKFQFEALTGQNAPNIDVDRYAINGRVRQVMLAARELDSQALPEAAQTWQNQKLAYTHGYGLVMSPVNKTIAGDPDYLIEGFPPAPHPEAAGLTIAQPEIYYGQLAHQHVYVNTQQPEFDYPSGQGAGSIAARRRAACRHAGSLHKLSRARGHSNRGFVLAQTGVRKPIGRLEPDAGGQSDAPDPHSLSARHPRPFADRRPLCAAGRRPVSDSQSRQRQNGVDD